eukprot:1383895-Amorphochlora_amoeboformis.AAC.1
MDRSLHVVQGSSKGPRFCGTLCSNHYPIESRWTRLCTLNQNRVSLLGAGVAVSGNGIWALQHVSKV